MNDGEFMGHQWNNCGTPAEHLGGALQEEAPEATREATREAQS